MSAAPPAPPENAPTPAARKWPTLTLDTARISDVMAARLAVCLLGHVLYLKSQVPFPVAQLCKMAGAGHVQAKSRAAKTHDALLAAFDLLASHLGTTFTALSTALARNTRAHPPPESARKLPRTLQLEGGGGEAQNGTRRRTRRRPGRAQLVFVLGPSVTSVLAARARVLFDVDGLDVRIWGERSVPEAREDESDDDNDDEDSGSDEGSGTEEDSAPPPPSPSPTPPPCSKDDCSSSDLSSDSGSESRSDPDSNSDVDPDDDEPDDAAIVDDEMALRTAERLLSRALAMANADRDVGLAADIGPTQTHVLLRAPRRFAHPAWVPRQTLTRTMDALVAEVADGDAAEKGAKRKGGVRTECVRVRCRADDEDWAWGEDGDEAGADGDEDDEMIWWSWSEKLIGFSEW